MTDKFAQWNTFYSSPDSKLQYPSETLIRIMKGGYIKEFDKNYSGKKVIDIGFGHGNNLLLLSQLGLELYGVEVHEEICTLTTNVLAGLEIKADLRQGTNRNISFPDDYFDFLVSWDVIHYEGDDDGIREAIKEYHRVLKPGGRFFLSTVGPENGILAGASPIGAHRYKIAREDDFRKGEVFFCFDTTQYVEYYFSSYFKDVVTGRTTSMLFSRTVDCFLATGVKP
jgi:SAM-dependent methyltransferase